MTTHPEQGNVHEEPNSFIGRERELGELREFVRVARALTLCGTGGIGKSRLAVRMLAALSSDFPDGVWFIELGDLQQPDLVVSRVAAAIGVVEERGRPLVETLAAALAPRRMLLALDNCEHVIDAAARLCQRLLASSPGLRMIATSREPLRVAAEVVFQVPPLSTPPAGSLAPADLAAYEAVQLFADRAAAAVPGFALGPGNAGSVSTLCRALDGVPLAIELAAAWVRVLSVEQIAARLGGRFQLLTTRDRTAPPRQRTLRATIDWSHDLLTGSEQVMLRRLSVFAGWSLDMAEEACSDDNLPADQMPDLITGLVDKSLVIVEPEVLGQTRYRMLDTIREYAAERLAKAGESAELERRLRDYSLRVAEESMAVGMAIIPAPWSARVDVFRRYDIDLGNALQVLTGCLADGDAETGLRICTAIRPVWIVRGTFAEGAEWVDSFLAIDAPGLAAAVRGPALVGRAQLALSSDPAGVREWAEEGLALCRAAGDKFWIAAGLNLLAEVALHTGRTDEAALHADDALALARAAGDGWNEGYALGSRAAAAAQRGNLREAQELADGAIAVLRDIDQQWGVARTLLGLGDLGRLRRDPGDARDRYLEALPILREIDSRPEIARCLAGLARIALDQGELTVARQHLAESIRLSHSTGSRIGVARGLEAFAALAVRAGQPARAVQLAAAAATLRQAAHLPPLAGARTEQYIAPARSLGGPAIQRLWAQGSSMTGDEAVALALDFTMPATAAGGPATAAGGLAAGGPAMAAGGPATAADVRAMAAGGLAAAAGGPAMAADVRATAAGGPAMAADVRATAAGGPATAAGGPAMAAGGLAAGGPAMAADVRAMAAGGLAAGSAPGAALPAVLTAREREIVALIAAGHSNKAIAEELFISPATAARHVANILAKLGFTSRAQVAAWAREEYGAAGQNGSPPAR